MIFNILVFIVGVYLGTKFHPQLKKEGGYIYLYYSSFVGRNKKKLFKWPF